MFPAFDIEQQQFDTAQGKDAPRGGGFQALCLINLGDITQFSEISVENISYQFLSRIQ